MQGNYLSPIIDAFKPILIFAAVLWGAETIITMLIKDHKKAKRKQAREKRRLEYQDRRLANDAEHAKVTRAMRYDVLRRDNFHCVRCGRGKEDGVKLHVDHIVPVSRGGKSVILEPKISMPKYSDPPLMKRAERPLSLRLQFLPKNISTYSMGGTTKQKGTICFVRKLAVRNEAMRKIS